MNINKLTVTSADFPEALRQLAQPPAAIFYSGRPLKELLAKPRVAIVGSRLISPYGRQVTARLAGELAEQGIVIVSGLAIGVDAAAHQAALEAGGTALAVLPGPVDTPMPASNRRLAQQILEQGGTLVSEYASGMRTQKHHFIARNRLVAGLSDAVLITEAAQKSGSLHTARFTLEQGKEVLAVPGNITSAGSVGANNLIKAGAIPVTDTQDVLHALGLKADLAERQSVGSTPQEQTLLDLLQTGLSDGSQLLQRSGFSASQFNQTLTMLEISGKIRSLGANHWGAC